MTTLTIEVATLKRLVDPVLPAASTDDMIPVLNAVKIETRGEWLTALATDRYSAAMAREKAPASNTWPEWSAVVPTTALRSLFTTFKGGRRGISPMVRLTIKGDELLVESDDVLLDMSSATIRYALETGQYPNVAEFLHKAIDSKATDRQATVAYDPAKANRLLSKVKQIVVQINGESLSDPILFTDNENYVGLLMGRRLDGGGLPERDIATWLSLTEKSPEVKKSKRPAKRKGAAA